MTADLQATGSQRLVHALRVAWIVWSALVLVTWGVLIITVSVVHQRPVADAARAASERWLWIIVGYYVIVVTAAFFRTGWLFRGYYSYRPVPPRTYVRGMTIVWGALTLGAWASLAVCFFTRTLLPNILLAAVGNAMLLALWPKGNAMAPPAANPADPGHYQEPR